MVATNRPRWRRGVLKPVATGGERVSSEAVTAARDAALCSGSLAEGGNGAPARFTLPLTLLANERNVTMAHRELVRQIMARSQEYGEVGLEIAATAIRLAKTCRQLPPCAPPHRVAAFLSCAAKLVCPDEFQAAENHGGVDRRTLTKTLLDVVTGVWAAAGCEPRAPAAVNAELFIMMELGRQGA